MARCHQGQNRSSGNVGEYGGLISPGVLRWERELIHRNSWKFFLAPSSRRPATPARMSLWILRVLLHYRTRALVTHHPKRVKPHSSLIEVHHLKFPIRRFEKEICVTSVNSRLLFFSFGCCQVLYISYLFCLNLLLPTLFGDPRYSHTSTSKQEYPT
jgi:hypothetical protein